MGVDMRKLLICILCMVPMFANAEVLYSVQGNIEDIVPEYDTYAVRHRFYVGGAYNFALWQNYEESGLRLKGKESFGFDAVLGIRATDILRIEANYMYTRAKWQEFALRTNTAFVNAIIDARIDAPYRFFYNQHFVPYIGAGGGLTWVKGVDVAVDKELVPAANVMAGIGIEFDDFLTLDLGYRYIYMFGPAVDTVSDFTPRAHQFRAGLRMNF